MAVYALGDKVPSIDPSAYVHPDAVIIGAVVIGPGSSVWPCAVVRGDDGAIHIGARTSIQDGAVIHCTSELKTVIGDGCVIGHQAHLEGCTIEDFSLVGVGAVVLHEAVVCSGALVGAGAVVTGGTVVPPAAMALGVPAKIREDAVDPELIADSIRIYVERAEQYRGRLRRVD